MHEIEITDIPSLSPGEQSLLDMHSVLNVLNVLRCELTVLGLTLADNESLFVEGIAVCDSLLASLHDRTSALNCAAHIEEFEQTVMAELDAKLAQSLVKPDRREVDESLANLRTVFNILKVRAREILARAAAPDRWDEFEIEQLRASFLAVFSAIEKNSKGRYRILYNAARQERNDYYVDLKIESAAGSTLRMPPVFQDVMRDLIANARKYTPPGGHITAALFQDSEAMRFLVEDTGRGIPEGELATVVQFGKRASNVGDVRTMGGGFGLTKAFLVTKQFGGRFWIASEVGVGTRVRICMPCPVVKPAAVAMASTATSRA
jgi:signal transduction histidine kinase